MIVDLKTITDTPRYYKLTHEKGWWKGTDTNDPILDLSGPLTAHIELSRTSNKYLIKGNIKGEVRVQCDRCLESYNRELDSEFEAIIFVHPSNREHDMEITEVDVSVEFVTGEQIELDDVIREQIYLSLPIKSICKNQCLGLCPSCGTNLNMGKCKCQSQ